MQGELFPELAAADLPEESAPMYFRPADDTLLLTARNRDRREANEVAALLGAANLFDGRCLHCARPSTKAALRYGFCDDCLLRD